MAGLPFGLPLGSSLVGGTAARRQAAQRRPVARLAARNSCSAGAGSAVCGHLTLARAVEDPSLSDEISLRREIVGRYRCGRRSLRQRLPLCLDPRCGASHLRRDRRFVRCRNHQSFRCRPEVDLSQLLADAGGLMIPRPAACG
jgi:hypothetical protein